MGRSKFMQSVVGVAAAAALSVGIGATSAAPAEAAGSVWDRVARCESGGRWHIATGNGYYGGLQFSRSTWNAFGGRSYATTASRATKSEQIAIARRVLASQGPRAWPVCSRKAGLTRSNGGANRHATAGHSAGASRPTAVKTTYTRSTSGKTMTVRRGDTLGKIAKRYHVSGGWRGLWSLNKSRVKNPDRIRIGQVLRVR